MTACLFLAIPIFLYAATGVCHGQDTILVPVPSNQSTQPIPQADENPSDLPSPAVWRIGDASPNGASNGYYYLAFSRDGRWLATRNRENLIQIHDVQARRVLCEVRGHDARIIKIDFSPDGQYFLTTAPGVNERVKVWKTQTGQLSKTLDVNAVDSVFSRDGNRIFCLDGQQVYRYQWPDGTLRGSQVWVNGVETPLAISRNGLRVVAYREIKEQIFQMAVHDLAQQSVILLDGPTFRPRSAVLSENGQYLAANHFRQSRVAIWNLNHPRQQTSVIDGHQATVQSLAFSDDSRLLVTASWDATAVVWDLLSTQRIARLTGHRAHVTSVAVAVVPGRIATGASGRDDSSILIWNLPAILFPNPPRPITMDQIDAVWLKLASEDPRVALDAVNDLRHALRDHHLSLQLLTERLGIRRPTISAETVMRQIRQLAAPRYHDRLAATRWLLNHRRDADAMLRQAMRSIDQPEIRYRLSRILRLPIRRPQIAPGDLRRLHRVIMALEWSDVNGAVDVLTTMADRHPHIDIARDARDALERIALRHADD